MEIWIVQAVIIIVVVFFAVISVSVTAGIVAEKSHLELPIQIIFIIVAILFFCYIMDRKEKVERYCVLFPETEICKAIDKNTGYLTGEQEDKMIQRVKEEDEKRKDFKNIQDIEVE